MITALAILALALVALIWSKVVDERKLVWHGVFELYLYDDTPIRSPHDVRLAWWIGGQLILGVYRGHTTIWFFDQELVIPRKRRRWWLK